MFYGFDYQWLRSTYSAVFLRLYPWFLLFDDLGIGHRFEPLSTLSQLRSTSSTWINAGGTGRSVWSAKGREGGTVCRSVTVNIWLGWEGNYVPRTWGTMTSLQPAMVRDARTEMRVRTLTTQDLRGMFSKEFPAAWLHRLYPATRISLHTFTISSSSKLQMLPSRSLIDRNFHFVSKSTYAFLLNVSTVRSWAQWEAEWLC